METRFFQAMRRQESQAVVKIQTPTLSSIFENDEKFGWLDQIAEPLQQTVHNLFRSSSAGMKIKSLLNGTPFRHRMHPALVVVPLGAWTTAFFFDLLDRTSSDTEKAVYRNAADTAIALGIVSALPAAKTGLADWTDLYDHRRRVGMAHALLNVAALACYGGSFALRKCSSDNRGLAMVLSSAGYGMVALGGSLGGELVYTLGVNVPHNLYPKPPNEFTDVLGSDELTDGKPVVVEVGRVPVMLVRQGSEIFATDAWCPHAGGPLADGTVEDGVVECPWHQSRFCLADGAPTQGPAASPLRTFEVKEEGGRIAVLPSYEGMSWPPPPALPGA